MANKTDKEAVTHLFSWDKVPGKDSEGLINFLSQKFGIDWIKTAKIEKIDDEKNIRISTGKNVLLLKLNKEKTKLNIEIDDGRTYKLIVMTECDKLVIYDVTKDVSNKNPDIDEICRSALSIAESLLNKKPECVTGVSREENAWKVHVEVLERKAVPDTQDILSSCELILSDDAKLKGYKRIGTRRRGDRVREVQE